MERGFSRIRQILADFFIRGNPHNRCLSASYFFAFTFKFDFSNGFL
jgi:hypothetical protein